MAMYCTECGKKLAKGETCSCKKEDKFASILTKGKGWLTKLLKRTGIGTASQNSASVFEEGQTIVPDIIHSNDGEEPIRQYDAATLRSRIRGQYAKGKLQVTNKRVLFRAVGMSIQGPISQQYEFAINEIAGVEIKKKNRISLMNICLCLWLNTVFTFIGMAIFSDFAEKTPGWAIAVAALVAILSAVPFFILHKKFWLKHLCLSLGFGALGGITLADVNIVAIALGIPQFEISGILLALFSLLWWVSFLLVITVPDMVLVIKTKGASPSIEIRRKQFPTPFRPMVEYTDFGEVLPGKDVDLMATELGALIDDIQTLGDMAIEKWKENK